MHAAKTLLCMHVFSVVCVLAIIVDYCVGIMEPVLRYTRKEMQLFSNDVPFPFHVASQKTSQYFPLWCVCRLGFHMLCM